MTINMNEKLDNGFIIRVKILYTSRLKGKKNFYMQYLKKIIIFRIPETRKTLGPCIVQEQLMELISIF